MCVELELTLSESTENRHTQTHFTRHIRRCWTNDKYEMWMRQQPSSLTTVEWREWRETKWGGCRGTKKEAKSILVHHCYTEFELFLFCWAPPCPISVGNFAFTVNPSDEMSRAKSLSLLFSMKFEGREHKCSRNSDSFDRREVGTEQRTTTGAEWKNTHKAHSTHNWRRRRNEEKHCQLESTDNGSSFDCTRDSFVTILWLADGIQIMFGVNARERASSLDTQKRKSWTQHEPYSYKVGIRLHNVRCDVKRRIRIPLAPNRKYIRFKFCDWNAKQNHIFRWCKRKRQCKISEMNLWTFFEYPHPPSQCRNLHSADCAAFGFVFKR